MNYNSRKLMTYNRVLKSLNNQQLCDMLTKDCSCATSQFQYVPHGHIITGDYRFIPDGLLQNLLSKGINWEPTAIDWDMVYNEALEGMSKFTLTIKRKFKRTSSECLQFYKRVKGLIRKRILYYEKISSVGSPHSLYQQVLPSLQQIWKNFIIASADKAHNNYFIVCKKFYLQALAMELGITTTSGGSLFASGNGTYQPCQRSASQIIASHKIYAIGKRLQVKLEDETLP